MIKFNILFLLVYLISSTSTHIDFIVEENVEKSNNTRHLHRLRHSRETRSHPYIAASSSVINSRNSNQIESFSLNCPHVADASNKDVRIEVIWTLNETIWLKIEDGVRKIVNGDSSFNKRRVVGKTVMRILLNNARYMFDYDELTGDFSMEISPVLLSSDVGSWQCHVTVWQSNGSTHTLTSRRRIKLAEEKVDLKNTFKFHTAKESNETKNDTISFHHSNIEKRGDRSSMSHAAGSALFSRPNGDTVYMTRKSEEPSSVVFARNDGPVRRLRNDISERESFRRMEAQIDYELDMDEDVAYPSYINSKSRIRSAVYYNYSPVYSMIISYLIATISLF